MPPSPPARRPRAEMLTVQPSRIERSQLAGLVARSLPFVAFLGLFFAAGMIEAKNAAAETQCAFEIIRGCRCPTDCNSDRCEVTYVVVGQDRRGNCGYQCPLECPCEGIACNVKSWLWTALSRLTPDANAAVPEAPTDRSSKIREIDNADGKFVIVPKEEMERLAGESAGIGISVVKNSNGSVAVGGVANDGPAGKAGLAAGDEIISVDGRKTEGLPTSTVTQWLRGRSATLVVLRVKGKDGKTRKVSLNRVELFTVGAAEKKKPDVTFKNLTLKDLKASACPGESGGCHLLTQDGEDCMYTCKKAD